jgi:hypothetical protein
VLVCRGGFGPALREPHPVLEDPDLAPYFRRVLVPLSAYVRARSSYVADQPFVFEDSLGCGYWGRPSVENSVSSCCSDNCARQLSISSLDSDQLALRICAMHAHLKR